MIRQKRKVGFGVEDDEETKQVLRKRKRKWMSKLFKKKRGKLQKSISDKV